MTIRTLAAMGIFAAAATAAHAQVDLPGEWINLQVRLAREAAEAAKPPTNPGAVRTNVAGVVPGARAAVHERAAAPGAERQPAKARNEDR